eukprot:794591-Heterocapsa_arctica.AAC.1
MKRGNTNFVAEGVSRAVGSITRFFTKRTPDVRISDASSSMTHPLEVLPPQTMTDINIPPPPGVPPLAE